MSFWRLYYHLVWATKNREPVITPEVETHLFSYLTRKTTELEVRLYALNGWHDHIHIVASIPPKIAVAEVVKTLKGASSHHLNHIVRLDFTFAWQRGYGALSVGERQLDIAINYVEQQKTHHANQQTNKWLEMVSDLDEGPDTPLPSSPHLRESSPIYRVDEPNDFPLL